MAGTLGAGMTHLHTATGISNGGNSKVGKNQVGGQPGLNTALPTGGAGLTPGLGAPQSAAEGGLPARNVFPFGLIPM